MTTQTETKTYKCARCGRSLPASDLCQDTYSGFLLCKDDAECDEAIEVENIRYADQIFFALMENDPAYNDEFRADMAGHHAELKMLAVEVARFENEDGI